MKELSLFEIDLVSSGNSPAIDSANAQIIKDITIDAGLGALTTPATPWVGAELGADDSIIHGAINNDLVSVPVPVLIRLN
ncbi:MAG: hypothetical protein ACSLEN_13975 [Candidatus Malihini olakiniferum]